MSSKMTHIRAFPTQISPSRHDDDKTRHVPSKNPEIHPFVIKPVLESNCKLSRKARKGAIRKNFNLKPDSQIVEIYSN